MISLFRGLRHAEAEVAPGRGQPETWGRRVLGRNCAGWGGAWDRWVQGAVVRGREWRRRGRADAEGGRRLVGAGERAGSGCGVGTGAGAAAFIGAGEGGLCRSGSAVLAGQGWVR